MTRFEDTLPEVCLNLWWYCDQLSGIVQRLAGRAYALTGTDEEKLAVLHNLARSDFHIAINAHVPSRFKVVSEHGTIESATTAAEVGNSMFAVFEELINTLERELPEQVHFISYEPDVYRLKLPEDPLHVLTCILEYPDGRLEPQA